MKKVLYIPSSMPRDDERIRTCNICGKQFREHEEAQAVAHLKQCVSDNMDLIHAESPRSRPSLNDIAPDPEMDEHFKRVARDMKREGRLTVKPNERAGFDS